MSTLTVTDIRRTGETAARSTRGIAASWLSLNGAGTIAVRDSQNISSVIDNGTGSYTENFTANMADTVYSFSGASKNSTLNEPGITVPITPATSSLAFVTGSSSFALGDANPANAVIHGDLA